VDDLSHQLLLVETGATAARIPLHVLLDAEQREIRQEEYCYLKEQNRQMEDVHGLQNLMRRIEGMWTTIVKLINFTHLDADQKV
jgi:hypothetical protein